MQFAAQVSDAVGAAAASQFPVPCVDERVI